MKRSILHSAILILLTTCIPDPVRAGESFNEMPLYFIENRGQVRVDAAYYVQGRNKALYFTSEGLNLALSEGNKRCTLQLEFLDKNPNVKVEGRNRQKTVFSFFKGKPSEWKRSVPTYGKLTYQELWPGIDLVYSGSVNHIKYEFIVRPGADPGRIRLAYRGATEVTLNETGALSVVTPTGEFEDGTPYAYQMIDNEKREVAVGYALEPSSEDGAFVYGFEAGPYDPRVTLVIDPVLLVYCGFICPGNCDVGRGIALDDQGRAYVAGLTGYYYDLDYDFDNGFVARVNANGLGLDYCIIIGGTKYDCCNGIAVDDEGRAYVTGYTMSDENTFPVVQGPGLKHSGSQDTFVARVNADGSDLDYCGYIGGNGSDFGYGIALDDEGRACVTGVTESDETSFPVLVGPGLSFNGYWDAYAARVKADGSGLDYCGYIGGNHYDYGYAIAMDSQGRAFITGQTGSDESSFPVLVGPDLSFNGGFDAFVARVEADGTCLGYCGYIGGTEEDLARGIAVNSQGNAFITGNTESIETSFPVAVGPDLTHNGMQDAFVARINTDGSGLDYCGYIGGLYEDVGRGIYVDDWGNSYVTGYTLSTEATFPVCVGPDLTHNGGIDTYLAKVTHDGASLDYCGYIGGINEDYGYDVAVDGQGNTYVTGQTHSDESSFPVVIGPKLTYKGFAAAFVTRIYSPLSSKIHYVDDGNTSGPWDGTWEHPFQYIQDGIDHASSGDTVSVMPGTYRENIDFKGRSVVVKSSHGSGVTVIDAQQTGSVATFKTGEFSESVLDGFTLMNGSGTYDAGSGSHSGGGIYCSYASPDILDNVILENTVDGSGGGIYCDHSFPNISNNIIHDNSAAGEGGGIFCSKSFPLIVNNSLARNKAGCGGGIGCVFASSPIVCNSVLWDNAAPSGPEIGMVNHIKPSTLFISHSDVKGGASNAYIESGCTLDWGAGMIDSDPLFADLDDGDLHLTFNSPCRGSGDNGAPSLSDGDFEMDPRVSYGTVDMGADEFHTHLYWTGDAAPGGSVELKFVGLPGTAPVQLWLGAGVMDPPMTTKYGDWHLQFPILADVKLGSIPSPEGIYVLPFTIPSSAPTPLEMPFQAWIGFDLTNLSVMKIE